MVSGSPIGPVVVGADGSASSLAAIEWAVQAAGRAHVHAVHVLADDHESDAEQLGDTVSPLVIPEFARGDRAGALLAAVEAHSARLVVIGRHRQRAAFPQRLGRLAVELLRRTSVPLAIVGETPTPSNAGAIVAGVGEGPATEAALAWAANWAAAHDAALELVRAVPHRPRLRTDGLLEVIGWNVNPEMARRWAADDVDAAARALADRDRVSIASTTATGTTAAVLSAAAAGASLVVVGLHQSEWIDSKRRLRGALLRDLLAVDCPIVIVPATES